MRASGLALAAALALLAALAAVPVSAFTKEHFAYYERLVPSDLVHGRLRRTIGEDATTVSFQSHGR